MIDSSEETPAARTPFPPIHYIHHVSLSPHHGGHLGDVVGGGARAGEGADEVALLDDNVRVTAHLDIRAPDARVNPYTTIRTSSGSKLRYYYTRVCDLYARYTVQTSVVGERLEIVSTRVKAAYLRAAAG